MATSVNLFKKISKTDTAVNRAGGYKPLIYFAPVNTFSLINQPGAVTNIGDDVTVSADDTFTSPEGYISIQCLPNTVTSTSKSIGDEGAQQLQHTLTAMVSGDSAKILSTMLALLNENAVWLAKDQDCINADNFIRLGDDCVQPVLTIDFDGSNTKDGKAKGYKMTLTITGHKVFYSGTVTEKP